MSTKNATPGAGALGRAQLRENGQVTLPAQVRRALHIDKGDEIEFRVTEAGEVVLRGMTVVPAEQRWFWTQDWQAGEREASAQIRRGEISTHDDVDGFFTDLNS